jgi:hypothetical protein
MAKNNPLKVLLFLILLLVVAYFCKRGWEGFYAAGDINIIEASYGLNCNGGNRGNITRRLQELINQQGDKSSFTFDGANPYQHFNKVFGDPSNGCPKSVEVTYDCNDGNRRSANIPAGVSESGTLRLSCPRPTVTCPPCPACPPPTTCPPPRTCPDMSQYILRSSCNSCSSPNACVNMAPYMLRAKCLMTDDDTDPPYMLIEDCKCSECKRHRQS